MQNNNAATVENSNFIVEDRYTFLQFCSEKGDPATQPTKSGKTCLVFTNPLTNEDTYVSISSKILEDENVGQIDLDFLNKEYAGLEVLKTPTPADVLESRKALQEEYLLEAQKLGTKPRKVQMESYVLCRKGQGTRKTLNFDWRRLLG